MATDTSVIEPRAPMVRRQRLLTNPSAEYIESGAVFRALRDASETVEDSEDLWAMEGVAEYAPLVNQSLSNDAIVGISKAYQQSTRTRQEFKQRLQILVDLLKTKKVDEDLGIELKNPEDFDLPYVLDIIGKIVEAKQKRDSYMSFVLRCFRTIEDNKDVTEGLLSIVPNDVYGCLISGGFALILICLTKHAERREATEAFLVQIQDKLGSIQRLTRVHYESVRVHALADEILVSVFVVLERIIDKITTSWQDKLSKPFRGLGTNVKGVFAKDSKRKSATTVAAASKPDAELDSVKSVSDALEQLQRCIDKFQSEIGIARDEMLGNVHDKVGVLLQHIVESSDPLRSMKENSNRDLDFISTMVANKLYLLLKSNSLINKKTEQVDHDEMKLARIQQDAQNKRFFAKNNKRIASKWLSALGGFRHDPQVDINDCLEHIAQLDCDERNVSGRIMDSDELGEWLQTRESAFFMVDVQPPPRDLNNPLSFTSALLAHILRSTGDAPVLAFFCKHRNNENPAEAASGALALANSLNGQLLDFIKRHRPEVDLSPLESQAFFAKSGRKFERALELLDGLLCLLPDGDSLFVVLDSMSCLSGVEENGNKLLQQLRKTARFQEDVCIKVLVTDPPVHSPLDKFAKWKLHVLDDVSGAGVVDVEDTTQRIERFRCKDEDE